MMFQKEEQNISLEKTEENIIDLAIVELGGPLHSSFAKHLQKYHVSEYDKIRQDITTSHCLSLDKVHLVIDVLKALLSETLENDWEFYYEENKKDVEEVLAGLIKIYVSEIKEY